VRPNFENNFPCCLDPFWALKKIALPKR
jgi:hypothetical protein